MPVNEIETHPYLNLQIGNFNTDNLDKYRFLIVGTFPIYAITQSVPTEDEGRRRRVNWQNYASLQYFYGSNDNKFWNLFCFSFGISSPPNNAQEAINYLNQRQYLVTDVYRQASRSEYSSSDGDLYNQKLNHDILQIITRAESIEGVLFTSKEAKEKFCEILDIPYNPHLLLEYIFWMQKRKLLINMAPPSATRTVPDYFSIFPPNIRELKMYDKGELYTLEYRKRFWGFFLKNFWG